MRKSLKITDLKSGMVLADTVKSKHGQTIAKTGTVLNHSLISRIKFYKINEVDVETTMETVESDSTGMRPAPITPILDEPTPLTDIDRMVASLGVEISSEEADFLNSGTSHIPETSNANNPKNPNYQNTTVREIVSYNQKLLNTEEYHNFQLDYTKILEELKQTFHCIVQGNSNIPFKEALQDCSKLFLSKTSLELFSMIYNMRSIEDSVYAHSLNVALISRTIGRWLKLGREDLDTLTLAGLFHDIGKLAVPEEILNKTEALTEEEFALIQTHPLEGNRMLKRTNADPRICRAALQHHERFDGSGYPRNLSEDEIDDFAAIVAIADVYDAMTASRSYRRARCAFQVIYEFEQEGFHKYKTKYILTFLERIANLYQNSQVILNDGRHAKVVYINKGALSRPVVELTDHKMLDLSRSRDLFISAIV